MTTAQRVRLLLTRNGDSIRDAARKSGLSKSTVARIIDGSAANVDKWVKQLAQAYKVDPNSLIGGLDPKSDFEWSIRRADLRERFEMVLMTLQDRVRLTMEFLDRNYPNRFSFNHVVAASGGNREELLGQISRWDSIPVDLQVARLLAKTVERLTAMDARWFDDGLLTDEASPRQLAELIMRGSHPSQRSGRPGTAKLTTEVRTIALKRLADHI